MSLVQQPLWILAGAPVGGQSGQVHRMRQVCAGLSPGEKYPGARGENPGGFFRLPGVRGLCTGVSQLRDPYLDIRYQLQILKLIRQLNQEYGITIVMVLHDINQSLYYSDEIVAMKDGKIIAHGLPEEVITGKLVKEVYDVDLND